MDETIIHVEDVEDEIKGYIEKINSDIGFYWWKRYIYSAFWSNISTPINLSIVVFTAITTGQTATKNLISESVSTLLGSTVLFVSIFNTFFRPNEQLAQNQKIMQDWANIGEKFDEIYYNRVYTKSEKIAQLSSLENLFKSMSSLKRDNDNNYCIDLIYLIVRVLCIRKNIKWITIKDIKSENVKRRRTLALVSSKDSPPENININIIQKQPTSTVSTSTVSTSTVSTSTSENISKDHISVTFNDNEDDNYMEDKNNIIQKTDFSEI